MTVPFDALEPVIDDVEIRMRNIKAAVELAQHWDQLKPTDKRARLLGFVNRIDIKSDVLKLSITPSRLPALLANKDPSSLDALFSNESAQSDEDGPVLTLRIPARLKRTGMEMRLLIDGAGGGARTRSDHSLCRLLAQAYRYQTILTNSRSRSMGEIAAEAGVTRSYFRRVLRMSFLAPDIIQAILRGRHPIELNARRISKQTVLPLSWDEQRKLLGFD